MRLYRANVNSACHGRAGRCQHSSVVGLISFGLGLSNQLLAYCRALKDFYKDTEAIVRRLELLENTLENLKIIINESDLVGPSE